MKIAVIYQSHYGATAQYAKWIAERLGAALLERKSVRPAQLLDYDLVIYGGGLYAERIAGVDLVVKNPCHRLVLFMVGLADPKTFDSTAIVENNLPPELRETVPVFHLHGGIDYGKLSIPHKLMMAAFRRMMSKKPESEQGPDIKAMLETYGKAADYTDLASIEPLVTAVEAMR